MSIINPNRNDNIETFVENHKRRVNVFFKQTLTQFQQLGESFWSNQKYTPEQIAAAYGPEAAELFTMSGAMAQLLSTLSGQPIGVVPEGYGVTVNNDGTVTIVAPIPTPEPSSSSSSSSAGDLETVQTVGGE